ncbi:MAG: type II secretion system protein GspM [Candidatus Thiodiazotropha sp.]
MIARLDGRKSRLLALLLFIVTLLLVVASVVLPVFVMNRHYDELITGMSDQLVVYQRVARNSKQYQAKFQQLMRLQRQDRRYLKSDTESLATAELQSIVKQVIAGNQGEILSTQVTRTTEEQGFKRITIRIRMKSTLEDMVKIFHTLESKKPYLFVENVNVRSRQVARRRLPTNKAIEEAMSQLDIDFQLSGYMRGGSA